ncbi:hypothetical protein N7522_006267 [Penicillium canescens]|nr:hypothetical protein N7522_006267 [Penicillium canescens]
MEDIQRALERKRDYLSSAPSELEALGVTQNNFKEVETALRAFGILPSQSSLSLDTLNKEKSLKEVQDQLLVLRAAKRMIQSMVGDDTKPLETKAALEAMKKKTDMMMGDVFGPYWTSYREDIERLSGHNAMNSANSIPIEKLEGSINKAAMSVMKSWKQLQKMRQSGKAELFKTWWKNRPADKRHSWLCTFPAIRQHSDSAIHLLANYPMKKGEIQKAFLEPILCQEDLLQANVLSELLVARSSHDAHPRMLLSVDAKLVMFGYWCRIVPTLAVAGRVGFKSPTAPGDVSYGIQFESDLLKHPHWSNPIIARYQLEVQEKTYRLLVSLLSADLPELPAASPIYTEPPSLLTQSMLQLHGKPNQLDWDLVEGILKASMEEALDDLWRLRTDELYWEVMFDDMGRNTEKFLRLVFGRIDTFRLACEQLRVHNGALNEACPHGDTCDDDTRTRAAAVSMHATLRSIVNEKLAFLEHVGWSPPTTLGATSKYLLELIKKNEPQIRVMGCDTALRTLETRLRFANSQDSVPVFIRLVLHDMSVIVSCMQETSKHAHSLHNELEEISAFTSQSNRAAVEWGQRDRSWEALADTILSTLGNQVHQLNQAVGNLKRPVRARHTDFWRYVDSRMPKSGRMNHIVRLIVSNAPVKQEALSNATGAWLSYSTPGSDSMPTQTQLKKPRKSIKASNGRKPFTLSSELTASAGVVPGSLGFQRPILTLTEKKDQEIWADLLDGQSQVPWKDFNAFLGRLCFINLAGRGSTK